MDLLDPNLFSHFALCTDVPLSRAPYCVTQTHCTIEGRSLMSMYGNSWGNSFFLLVNYPRHLVTVKPSSMAHSQMCLWCLILSDWQDLDCLRWQVAGGACGGVSRLDGKTCLNMVPLHSTGVPGWINTWETQAEHRHYLLCFLTADAMWPALSHSCCGGFPTDGPKTTVHQPFLRLLCTDR